MFLSKVLCFPNCSLPMLNRIIEITYLEVKTKAITTQMCATCLKSCVISQLAYVSLDQEGKSTKVN